MAFVSRGQIHNGTWYMYYIVGGECPGRWVAYAYATSTDGVARAGFLPTEEEFGFGDED